MPLVALLDGQRVEAPGPTSEEWGAMAKDRLRCPECDLRMIARRPSERIAHFAHFRRTEQCTWGIGETKNHLQLKWRVAELVRHIPGWSAELEVADRAGTWRAEVMVTSPDGRRTAIEVQLASQTHDGTDERVRRYASGGINAIWVTRKIILWSGSLPTFAIATIEAEEIVSLGTWKFADERRQAAEGVPFAAAPRGALLGSVRWQPELKPNRFASMHRSVIGGEGRTTQTHLDQ